ncbi:MAG: amino acid adenylation domain-containing protein [Bacteroidetes bacterium]|nr:amino acid adenylation domain-containing protein [Bacteroidota bacterium]
MLPDYMVPTSLVVMDSFPLTANGKLDRRALPDPELGSSNEEYVSPTTETEMTICSIWQEVLGLEKVGITDDFFRMGGNSILAVHASHKMDRALGCDVKVVDIFEYKTVSQLIIHSIGRTQVVIPKTETKSSPLSFAQDRLWFIEQYEDGTNAYHIPAVLELGENTEKDGVKYALEKIVTRHDLLRSTIEQDENQTGIQVVYNRPLVMEEVFLTEEEDLEGLIKEDIDQPFKLSTEYPIRIKFYTIGLNNKASENAFDRIVLLVNIHHIAADGWSMEIFKRELSSFYEAYLNKDTEFSLPPLEIQYKDYAVWQRSYLTGEVLESQLNYWKNKLSGYQTLALPTDYTRPNAIDYNGDVTTFKLSKETSNKLRALAKANGTTLHSTLLAATNILLSKYSGQDDIVLGSPIANRHYKQTQGLIGFFVNTQVNRTLLNKSQSYEELIQQVHQEQVSAQLYQDLPFERLVDELGVERDTSRHPIFQVMFAVQSFDGKAIDSKKEYFKPFQGNVAYKAAKFDLVIFLNDRHEEISGQLSYALSLFNESTITRLADHYTHLIDQLVETPNKIYDDISLLPSEEYNMIVEEWNNTDTPFSKNKTICNLFQEQVKQTPDNVAILFEEQKLTYRELNEKSNQLAVHIRDEYKQRTNQELKPDTIIALCLDRSLEMIIGIHAILKAGGAYMPIDPNYPEERIKFILEDANAQLILSQRHLNESSHLKLPENSLVLIDLDEKLYQERNQLDNTYFPKPNHLAYVIYTSGSTGKPKGVMTEHRSIINRLEWMQTSYPLNSSDIVLQKTPYVFDVSVWELLWANWYGGKIVFAKPDGHKDSDYLYELIENHKITTLHFVPGMLDAYLMNIKDQSSQFNYSVKQLFCSGEALKESTVIQLNQTSTGQSLKLYNLYGPTEASIDVTYFETKPYEKVYIGKPIQNIRVYVLDSNMNPVPVGVIGELFLSGIGLSRGYINNSELTQEKFISNPFTTKSKHAEMYNKLYKTGDLVRWSAQGNLEYIGRNDDQLKLRGYRIELGEIENVLSQIDGIEQSCILVKDIQSKLNPTQLKSNSKPEDLNTIDSRADFITSKYRKNILKDEFELVRLNEDLNVATFNKSELEFLHHEIFQSNIYANGIDIKKDDVIFDVGSNIGISSIYFAKQAKDLTIYSFEPIGKLYDLLNLNLFIYSNVAKFRTFDIGIGSENLDDVPFSFFKNNTIISTRFPSNKEDRKLLSNHFDKIEGLEDSKELVDLVIDSKEEVRCKVRTISSIIRDESIECIDLLKIDVERAELDVLQGIEKQDWSKIRQIIVEVFDKDNRLEEIKSLLTEKQFKVNVCQEKGFEEAGIYILYAVKDDSTRAILQTNKNKTRSHSSVINNLINGYKEYELGIKQGHGQIQDGLLNSSSNKYLVGYYVLDRNYISENSSYILESWENLYDTEYEKAIDQTQITSDFTSWNSYINGSPIPIEEMESWRNSIVELIRPLNLQSVLEIGVGSGLLMYPLLKDIQKFVGLDISKQVIDRHKTVFENKSENVEFLHLKADQIDELPTNERYSTIIINSVCQYFPSIQYFEDVLEKAIDKLSDQGSIFLGDIRNYSLHKELIQEKLDYEGGSYDQQDINRIALKENELLISPNYFANIKNKYPNIKVNVLERNGVYTNELSKYRYDVVISLLSKKTFKDDKVSNLFTNGLLASPNNNYYNIPFLNQLGKDDIREQLTKALPDYMIPTNLVAMDSFPLTINGKLDKQALPDPHLGILGDNYVAPNSEIEITMCNIWQDLLGIDKIGVNDDFFKIGGNSILAVKLSHQMSTILNSELKVADIFELTTIRAIMNKIALSSSVDDNIEKSF